jgi:hypothetical protein
MNVILGILDIEVFIAISCDRLLYAAPSGALFDSRKTCAASMHRTGCN